MPGIKRSPSTEPDGEIVTPSPPPAPAAAADAITPTTPKKTKSPKKAKATPAKHDKPQTGAWTSDEDAVFLEVMEALVKEQMWSKIKDDGRLEYRGNPGVRAHVIAFPPDHLFEGCLWGNNVRKRSLLMVQMNKLKKGAC